MPAGRPSTYTEELADTICEHLSLGKSVREVAQMDGMPSERTIWMWRVKQEGFYEKYLSAKRAAMDVMADELLQICDAPNADWAQTRLQLDTRKWLMSKIAVKQYGDSLKHSGNVSYSVNLTPVEDEL